MTEQKNNKRSHRKRGTRREKPKDDFEQRIVDLARVTRVMAGGKRMRFRACVVVGNQKGSVGIGVAKGHDVATAVNKAVRQAKKNILQVPIVNGTIPHEVKLKYASAQVLLRPARQGRGLIAGGAARLVLELAGVPNVVAKMMGSRNKVNNVSAVMKALESLRTVEAIEQSRN